MKIKITLENKRLLRLQRCLKTKIWCAECEMETDFTSENEISDILIKLNANEGIHKILTTDGTTWICLESLTKIQV